MRSFIGFFGSVLAGAVICIPAGVSGAFDITATSFCGAVVDGMAGGEV
jgi:hypothetical protein